MTRDQALRTVRAITESAMTERQIADFVDSLRALQILHVEDDLTALEALAASLDLANSTGPLTAAKVAGHLNVFGFSIARKL